MNEYEKLLIGKTVLFMDSTQGFERYGKIKSTARIKLLPIKKADGKLVKRPTAKGFKVVIATGKVFKITPDMIIAVRWYGKDLTLKEFVADRL